MNISVNDLSYLLILFPFALVFMAILKKIAIKSELKPNIFFNFLLTMLFFPVGFIHFFVYVFKFLGKSDVSKQL